MATKRICSVEGCDKPICAKGLCPAHYWLMRKYGDPLAGATSHGTLLAYLRNTVLPYEGSDCLIWPFGLAKTGYAVVRIERKYRTAHRFICEKKHGPAPTQEHQAAHSCGVRACVNPQHLQWKTPSENQMDRVIHGTSNRGESHGNSKLSKADIHAIREAQGTQSEIAAKFGIRPGTVSKIKLRQRWRHI